MALDDNLVDILHGVGQKATPQRLAILSALRGAERHMTAAELFDAARPASPAAFDQSTVYRTLVAAEQAGLVARFLGNADEAEFEWIRDQHHHLVCDVCGGVSTLPESVFNGLVHGLLAAEGFLVSAQHLALSGTCANCLDAGRHAEPFAAQPHPHPHPHVVD